MISATKPAWTPGPWTAGPEYKYRGNTAIFSTGDCAILPALGNPGPVAIAAGTANAQLIAAAPDLHDALATAVELFELDDEANNPGSDAYTWLHVARAALAKARSAP